MSVLSILIGVVSGVIAAEVYRHFSFGRSKKVEIEICNYLIKRFKPNGIQAIQIKIKNKSKRDLADVYVKLFGIKYNDSEKLHQNRVLLAEKNLDFFPKFDEQDEKCNYFYVPSLYSFSDNIHEEVNKYEEILILVKATDYFDNNIVIVEKIVDKSKIKDYKWNFENCKCSATKRDDVKIPSIQTKKPVKELLDECPFLKGKIKT